MRAMGGRPVLMERFPHGVGGKSFFQKRVPDNAPDWLETTIVSTPNGTTSRALVAADLAHVAWAVNLGCLGFHVWPSRADDQEHADELRIDLDPQPGVAFDDVRVAAHEVRAVRRAGHRVGAEDDRQPRHPRLRPARAAAGLRSRCARVRSRWRASSPAAVPTRSPTRGGRRSAASGSSSTSTRTRRTRRCSARGRCGRDPVRRSRRRSPGTSSTRSIPTALTVNTVPARVAEQGDPWERLDAQPQSLEPLLELYERDLASGMQDAPWPPVYPKMPGEPPRVAPSRAKKA